LEEERGMERARRVTENGRKWEEIARYKQKLLHLLKKLRVREANQ
jgi:hypothetical protein